MSGIKQRVKKLLLKTVWAFGPEDVVRTIRRLGVRPGDVMMVHAGWRPDSGFRGSVQDLVQAFLDAVGPEGTLCMMSMPFHGMTMAEYLKLGKVFDVRRTVSMVGLPSEVFRRRKGVVRSLHPTHSVAAYGPKAEWLIEGHERCASPFGKGSPFDKMVEAKGKILIYGVPFNTMTFEHYLEDLLQHRLQVSVYSAMTVPGLVIDSAGRRLIVKTKVISDELNRSRNTDSLYSWMKETKVARKMNLKHIVVTVVDAGDAVKALLRAPEPPPGWHIAF
ncbi:AAC(3) family N-acetyltransferase [Deferrisoma camini]|uniref:AAC(3) family N-acetyltransferase n=1 Tax=Deferrisoma camini TaxID=1035120 RepID=UPI00046CD54F|nr:AAC(3) family N-acetyltransferase [Deferrisoma camini]